ncbi:MAG TPA: cytochrome P460 family protein [Pyrinomonadaceae bacterium]
MSAPPSNSSQGQTTIRISQGRTRILLGGAGTGPTNAPPPRRDKESGGHTYGVVYANQPAREALASGSKFPAGSIIVREKLSAPDAATPQLVAVMFKRAPGFNPKGGDWEFLTADGALTKITARQKRGGCLDCHASQRAADFVFSVAGKR